MHARDARKNYHLDGEVQVQVLALFSPGYPRAVFKPEREGEAEEPPNQLRQEENFETVIFSEHLP